MEFQVKDFHAEIVCIICAVFLRIGKAGVEALPMLACTMPNW